jgi:hypothetical protein
MTKRTQKIVGEICLYGAGHCGAGWLATTAAGQSLGTGELNQAHNFTAAVFQACDALRAVAGPGLAWVYESNGQLRAQIDISRPCYFGDLKWEAAPVYTISMADILAAAE